MTEKMLESTRTGTTRSFSYLASIYDNDYLELWKNGQVIEQGGSSRTRQKITPSCIGYSKDAKNKDACIAKSAKLSTLHSLLDSSHGNSHQSIDQNSSCQVDMHYSKSNSNCSKESKLTYLSSKQQYLPNPSAPFKKPRIMHSSQTSAASKSLIQNLAKANNDFSNALRPSSVFIAKSTNYNVRNATLLNKNTVAEATAATDDDSAVIDSSRGTRASIVGIQGKNSLVFDKSNPVLSFVASNSKESIHCKKSETVGHNSVLREKRKAETNSCNKALVESSSICSLGASNNFDTCSRKQEETDFSTRLSDNDEETEDAVKEKDAWEGARIKRSRNAETHNLSEKKRRDKINKKMRVLKELIPNCNKVDKASMLDDAIEYLKTLKLQLEIMSMGAGLRMPLMMLPTASHRMINTPPHLPQLMGFKQGGTGIPPCNLPQFPIPPFPPAAAAISDINRVRMFGFPNPQMLSMPIMPHAPFIPMVGKPSTQPLQPTCSAVATNTAENL